MRELPIFHDCHAHIVERQRGGFLIALEGRKDLPYMLSNAEVYRREDRSQLLFAVPYAHHAGPDSGIESALIKYHARREGYTPEWVAQDLVRFPRRIALVDTLNSIDWEPRSYLDLAVRHPLTQFLFCHAGGYDIMEFLKMARFARNVWLDFSATQEIFGWVGNHSNLPMVTDAITHALAEPRIAAKVLFGSDVPGFQQAAAVHELIDRVEDATPFLTANFERLVSIADLV